MYDHAPPFRRPTIRGWLLRTLVVCVVLTCAAVALLLGAAISAAP